MGDRERNSEGRYADGIDPETVLDVFELREDLARPVTAGDVVDELGIARRTAHNKLNRLVERGELDTRKVGARGRVWWRPIQPADTPPTTDEERHTPTEAAESGALGDALDGWAPDTEANPSGARAQTRRAAEWLREVGGYHQANEFRDTLAGDVDLSERVWWERHAQPGLSHLADADLVEYVKNRGYRWVGDT
jgi:hypothetical protein